MSEDSDSDGPTNLFHEYDVLSDANTPNVNMDKVFTDDENTGRQSEDASMVEGFEIGEERGAESYKIGLRAMQIHHILYHQKMMKKTYIL